MRFSKIMPAKRWMLVISCVGVLGLVTFSGFLLFEATKAQVDITDNGEKETVLTHADTVKDLLDEEGITVDEHDDLSPGIDTAIEDGMGVEYKTAKQVIVTIDKDNETYYTTVDTVGEFLDDEDIQTEKHDDISESKIEEITDGLELSIDKAFQVTIDDGGDKSEVWTTGSTIEQLLDNQDISLSDNDKVKPALDKKAKEDKTIEIVRVDTETDKEEESLAFDTVTEEDDSLKKGKEKVKSEGKKGKIEKKFEITKENGEEVEKELVDEEVTKESKDKVVSVGTKEPDPEPEKGSEDDVETLSKKESNDESGDDDDSESEDDEGGEPEGDGEEFNMKATGYTANCTGCSGVTSTGIDLNENPDKKVVAVDPDVIPLGSEVWIEGYGEAVAGDTGGDIKGKRIDIFVPDKEDTHQYNMNDVKVKVIDEK